VTTILVLFGIGLLMLSLEIFLPGGVLGVMGGLTMLGAVVLAFRDYGLAGGALSLSVALVAVCGALYLELVVLPKTRLGRGLVLAGEVTGKATEPADPSLVGRPCVAATVLAPSGFVTIDGRRFEASCRDGFAEAGTPLVVHSADNFRLVVSKTSS